jgi:hypothetical protein
MLLPITVVVCTTQRIFSNIYYYLLVISSWSVSERQVTACLSCHIRDPVLWIFEHDIECTRCCQEENSACLS